MKIPKPMNIIGSCILSLFVIAASTISTALTYLARVQLFSEKLSPPDTLLLTVIFGTVAAFIFVFITPVCFDGERKKSEDW